MNIVIGLLVVSITIYLLVKRHDFKVVLLASGLLLAGIALDPLTVLDEFAYKMVTDSLIQGICSAVGFQYVMRFTGCEDALLNLVGKRLQGRGLITIPVVTLVTFAINSVLISAANTAAVAGIIFIPLLIRSGVGPAVAASAVLAGTFGSMLNPTMPTNTFVARISAVNVQTVASVQALPVFLSVIVGALCLTGLAFAVKEHRAIQAESGPAPAASQKPLNIVFALLPVTPLVILVLGASDIVPVLRIGIVQAMFVGSLLGLLLTRSSAAKISDNFFHGMGTAYAQAMGMVISVAVFVRGMKSIGLVSYFITLLTTTPEMGKIAGILGPFLMGIMTGSGDAAAVAFSEVVAPHAFLYEMVPVDMGSLVVIAGALGRTMSPLAGATIICAYLAKVNPVEVAKLNCPGMCAALLISLLVI